MPIPRDEAMTLVEAWESLDKYPYRPPAVCRLAQTLADHSRDIQHAREISRQFSEKCPRPADIIAVAARLLRAPDAEDPVGKMFNEFEREMVAALQEGREDDVAFYERCQPERMARVRRRLGVPA